MRTGLAFCMDFTRWSFGFWFDFHSSRSLLLAGQTLLSHLELIAVSYLALSMFFFHFHFLTLPSPFWSFDEPYPHILHWASLKRCRVISSRLKLNIQDILAVYNTGSWFYISCFLKPKIKMVEATQNVLLRMAFADLGTVPCTSHLV